MTTPQVPRQTPRKAPVEGSRLAAGRPAYFPTRFSWLGVGIGRNWRGVMGALVCTWFNVPLAILLAITGAVLGAVLGYAGGTLVTVERIFLGLVTGGSSLPWALDVFLILPSGLLGGLIGGAFGLVLGFVGGMLLLPGALLAADPLAGTAGVLGLITVGLLVGLLYTLFRVAFEGRLLRLSGARRMSRREQALVMPIVQSCTWRLGLAGHPPVLMDDSEEPGATAHARHVVINQGLLVDFEYDREVIAGAVCHELVHWRNGDPISAAFVRGAALPLYAVYGAANWLIRKVDHRLFYVLVWLFLWPVAVSVKYIIMPLQAADTRRAELRADQGAVMAGHRAGMRRILEHVGHSFEAGPNGWTKSVSATHPPSELRLERLEDPTGSYPLPDPDRPAVP